jgi:cyclophilin family peptidyl-prolyl cis-trans isomerase
MVEFKQNNTPMKKFLAIMFLLLAATNFSSAQNPENSSETLVLIHTELGDMKLKLYNDTPEHRKNFLKLVSEGYYDGILFHRVIKNFMIQGGDPDSKTAKPGARLGSGNPGYTIPAEFVPTHFHKKGALAAARKPDSSNPEKRSSGSQFYIVHGEVSTNGMLDTLEMMLNNRAKNEFYKQHFAAANEELNTFRKNNDRDGFNARVAEIRAEADSMWEQQALITFTPEQREIYTTVGGYPSLDHEYTVFGELVEGFDVLDKIAELETDRYDRPIEDIKMTMEVIK